MKPTTGSVRPLPLSPDADPKADPRTEMRTAIARCAQCAWTHKGTGPALELARALRAELIAHTTHAHPAKGQL